MGQRAAIYCRVSTADQWCERQERELAAFAARANYDVVATFKETGSGAKLDRAERKKVVAPGPVGLLSFIFGLRLIPKPRRERATFAQFDLLGALNMTSALLLLVYALVEVPENGWTSGTTLGMAALSILLIIVFIFVEQRLGIPSYGLASCAQSR